MKIEELISELRKLNCVDKLRVMQVLVAELAADEPESLLIPGATYEIWSPYDSHEAAIKMLKLLETDQNKE